MVGKSKLKKRLKQIQALKTWQLLILLILTLFIDATALRLNNVGMEKRRQSVLSADKELNESVAIDRLTELRSYVNSHMNANTGRIPLQNILNRDYDAAVKEASEKAKNNPNGNIFKKAESVCKPRFMGTYGYIRGYIQCILDEQQKYPAENSEISLKQLPTEAYQYEFSSPLWTPDLAGWTTLISLFIVIFILVKIITTQILKMILKKVSPNL